MPGSDSLCSFFKFWFLTYDLHLFDIHCLVQEWRQNHCKRAQIVYFAITKAYAGSGLQLKCFLREWRI